MTARAITGPGCCSRRWKRHPFHGEVSLAAVGIAIERTLDALNFFLADVRDGLGPYLAIYLLTEQKWDQASIGVVMSVAAVAGIVAQTPAGTDRPE